MTTTQHTPGPWHIGSGNGEGSIFAKNGRMRLETGGTTLYAICHNVSTWNIDEDDANARLIAAAPDLLEALETCVSELNQLAFLANDKLANAAIEKSIEAIRKAKEGAK
jgi:hypothetical protein